MPSWPQLSVADLGFVAGIVVLIHLSRRRVWLYAVLALPGTLLHELAHWLVALLLGGQPTAISFVPVRSERGWRLGSVGVRRLRWFNALPIGAAPLLLAPLAVACLRQADGLDAGHWSRWAALYVATAAAVSCLPSLADWKIVASRPFGLLLYAALLAAGGWWWWTQR